MQFIQQTFVRAAATSSENDYHFQLSSLSVGPHDFENDYHYHFQCSEIVKNLTISKRLLILLYHNY